MIETNRLNIYTASIEQMTKFIERQSDEILKVAYNEMLTGCLLHPDQWDFYAIWMIELKDGTHVGELCFKGISKDGITEIGYGINTDYQGNGFATEAVSALTAWALKQPKVVTVKAEIEDDNVASKRVLEKAGFTKSEKTVDSNDVYFYRKK